MNNRDHVIDLMRALGLILIVLAHTIEFGTLVFHLRNFDVPMMAVVAGMAFAVTAPDKLNVPVYYWKRFLRLVFPTWVFLTIFFLFSALGFRLAGEAFPFPADALRDYFLLGHGGKSMYVWIIRVFLLMALSAPGLLWLWRKVKSLSFALILLAVYAGYECAYAFIPTPEPEWARLLVCEYTYYLLPYSIIFGVGMLLSSMQWQGRMGTALLMGLVLVACIFIFHEPGGVWFHTQTYKYPATAYYVSWGVGMSALLSALFMKVRLPGIIDKGILFIGNTSLWIYLWHMAVLFVMSWHPNVFGKLNETGFLKFVFVLVVSALLTAGHRMLCMRIIEHFPRTKGVITNAFLR